MAGCVLVRYRLRSVYPAGGAKPTVALIIHRLHLPLSVLEGIPFVNSICEGAAGVRGSICQELKRFVFYKRQHSSRKFAKN